ncbi:MAG: tyrosine--tRNA ligase [Bacilli bacterium]|nr:tyrosine--tRNA ligase [Bacilli bacterium]MBO6194821.1 tyrosine--tRNA ligase [Bacilli bacterium]
MNLYEDLMYRGLIKDVASEDLEKVLNGEPITFYWGTDPTADSLTIGHYSSLVTAKRLAKAGHHPILLVGGATGLIGDPRPTSEREIISKETLNTYFEGIKKQVSDIFDNNVEIVNNYDWFKDISWIDFLRDIGKYINVNYMLAKDIINRRLETGITFAEFAYTLMQGYDYLYLYETKNVTLECAGSDQWGNITTGVDLINKKLGKQVNAFTMPLILDSSGKKIGKSEGNALWLDKNKTSSYELYQYYINTPDEKVEEYLKVFTFLTKEEIEDVMKKHTEKPEERLAQKTLAKEFIIDLHGEEEYLKAVKITEALFSGNIASLNEEELKDAMNGVETHTINEEMNIVDMLVNTNILSSKREAREFVNNGSISINGERITDLELLVNKEKALYNKYIVVRRGKKKYYLVIFE